MKNIFKYLLLLVSATSLMVSCVESDPEEEKRAQYEETYSKFVSAYTSGDFIKAREHYGKLAALNETLGMGTKKLNDTKMELFRAEAAYIIATNPDPTARIVLLIQQDFSSNNKEACMFVMNEGIRTKNNKLVASAYSLSKDYLPIFQSYIEYVGSMQDVQEATLMLEDAKVIGQRLTPGLNAYYDGNYSEWDIDRGENNGAVYSKAVAAYNSACTRIIKKCVATGELTTARLVLGMMLPNLDITMGEYGLKHKGVEVDGNHCYAEYTNRDINAAKALLR